MFRVLYEDDVRYGDVTSELVVPPDMNAVGEIVAQEPCVVAGESYLRSELKRMSIEVDGLSDGTLATPGEVIITMRGNARKLLSVERTVLNILSRLCGIATETRKIVDMVREVNPHVRIAATRKTLWGRLDKIAVTIGGGDPHRWNLGDMIMVKDNHIALVGLDYVYSSLKSASFTKKVEMEADTEEQAVVAAEKGVDIIMLDNFSPEDACRVAGKIKNIANVLVEFSGGITPVNVLQYAKCPEVDIISMGYLTHSAHSVNLSMRMEKI